MACQRPRSGSILRRNRAQSIAWRHRGCVPYPDRPSDKRNADKRAKIAAAMMPVDGIEFAEDESILLSGLPFEQASDAEQLRASIAIAMAANPRLRVIRVRGGSLLEEDAQQ
jgi:hypothetical protein